jgi:hypothetical protein
MDRQVLLANMRAGRERLAAALAQMDEARMVEPVLYGLWSVKDMLAHLGFWEQHIVAAYRVLQRGDIPDPAPDETSLHAVNARVFAEHRGRPLADVQREEGQAYQALLSLAETAPVDDLFDPHRFPWTQGHPLAELIANNTYEHYDEHLQDLQSREIPQSPISSS